MKKLLVMDEKNYGESLEEIYHVAVRSIISSNRQIFYNQVYKS